VEKGNNSVPVSECIQEAEALESMARKLKGILVEYRSNR